MRALRLVISLLCLVLTTHIPANAETLRITNGEWPPFTSRRLPHGGPLSQIVTEAFERVGITVEYGYFPWKRAYEYARSGVWHGSVAWDKVPEHQRDFVMSDPIVHVDKVLFYRTSAPLTGASSKTWLICASARPQGIPTAKHGIPLSGTECFGSKSSPSTSRISGNC